MSVTPNTTQYGNSSVIQVSTTFTGASLSTIWTPAAGRRITFKGCSLRARVTTTLAATAGDAIFLCDNAIGNLLIPIGVIGTATDAAGKDFSPVYFDMDMGYRLAATGNVLKVGTTATIGAGVIAVHGFVWGIESL